MSKRENQAAKPAAPEQEKRRVALDGPYIGKLAGVLLGITAVTALLLGAVNYVTAPIIAQATEEKRVAAMEQVLEAEEYPAVEDFVQGYDGATVTALSEAISGGETIGYVAEVTTNGFGGAISLVVGVNADGTVSGVAVIDHAETPNVGSKVVDDQAVLDQAIGLGYPVTVNSGDNAFDAVSGATVSSRAVVAGINAALEAVAAAAPLG